MQIEQDVHNMLDIIRYLTYISFTYWYGIMN